MKFKCTVGRGLSLVEVMISLLLVSLLVLACMNAFTTQQRHYLLQQTLTETQQSLRFAFGVLEADLARTGFAGCLQINTKIMPTVMDINHPMTRLYTDTTLSVKQQDGLEALSFVMSDSKVFKGRAMLSHLGLHYAKTDGVNAKPFDIVLVTNCFDAVVAMATKVSQQQLEFQRHFKAKKPIAKSGLMNTTGLPDALQSDDDYLEVYAVKPVRYWLKQREQGFALMRNNQALLEGVSLLDIALGIDEDCDGKVDRFSKQAGLNKSIPMVKLSLTLDQPVLGDPQVTKLFKTSHSVCQQS